MNEEKFRMLRERLLESLEEYREIGDQEIYQRIDELLLDDSMEHYMRLAERYALRKEPFNSIRRLDILQELLEDDTITEIMVNGTDGIFIERYGQTDALGEMLWICRKAAGYRTADRRTVQPHRK